MLIKWLIGPDQTSDRQLVKTKFVSYCSWGSQGRILKWFGIPFPREYSLEGLMLKLKLQYFGHLMQRTDSLEKTLILGKIEIRRRRG